MQQGKLHLDRRSAVLLGVVGTAAAVLGKGGLAFAEEGTTKELAPGVTLKTLKETDTMIPGYAKVQLLEATFQPGSKLGPITMDAPMLCEITNAPLEQHIEGMAVRTLQPGDIYTCHPGMVETDVNPGSEPCIMRIFKLVAA